MEQLLEVDDIEDALSGCLDIIVKELDSEGGAIWLLDPESNHIHPMFHIGPEDMSGLSIENGIGIEGLVTKTGESLMIRDPEHFLSFDGSAFSDFGMSVNTMICVPLNNLKEVIGCVQIVNKHDGSVYTDEELTLCEHMASLAAITIDEKGLLVKSDKDKKILISLRDIIKDYPSGEGTSRVLKGINLDIYEDELVVVLGESGCGKSTMMNIIGGMDNMTDGHLYVEGRDFSNPSDDELTMYRRHYVGFIFQSYNLMPNLTAGENVKFIAELAKDPLPSEEALDKVGLKDKYYSFPSQLSGGQQQRISIARALVKRPRIILADEPTAALDFTTGQGVLKVIEDVVKNHNTTVVMVTHNVEIAKMADRVVKLRSGRIASIKRNYAPLSADDLSW